MAETLKKIISGLLFLTPSRKKSLLAALDKFSEKELEQMYKTFSSLKKREIEFLAKFFQKNPDMAKKLQITVSQIKSGTVKEIESKEHEKELEHIESLLDEK